MITLTDRAKAHEPHRASAGLDGDSAAQQIGRQALPHLVGLDRHENGSVLVRQGELGRAERLAWR